EVAGGILRRQQAERRARTWLYGIHAAGQLAIGISVDSEFDGLAGAHVGELRLLVVRDNPDFIRDEHRQALAGGDEDTRRTAQLDDAAGLGRHDVGIAEVQFCLVELRLRLLQRGTRAFKLRFERLDSQLRAYHGGFGASRIGFLSLLGGARLLLALNPGRTCFAEVPRPALPPLPGPAPPLR